MTRLRTCINTAELTSFLYFYGGGDGAKWDLAGGQVGVNV